MPLYANPNNGLDTAVGVAGSLLGFASEREQRKAAEAAAAEAEARARQAAISANASAAATPWWKSRAAMIGGAVLAGILVLVLVMRKKGK